MAKPKKIQPDSHVIGECLDAAADGPFFPDWEFHSLFGLHKDEVRVIARRWPDVNWWDDDVRLAVNNTLNNLIGYPHRAIDAWSDWISVPRDELLAVLARWRGDRPSSFFDAMK